MNVTPQEVAQSILRFLREEYDSEYLNQDCKESIEVAIDCIKKVYDISGDDFTAAADIANMISRSKAQFDPSLADKFRADGNLFMSEKKYVEALEAYDKAVQSDPSNHVHYANRAAAYLKLDRFINAADDSQISINLNPNFHKGFGRKGLALMGLNNFYDAKEHALKLDPENAVYKEKLASCQAKIDSASSSAPPGLGGLESILGNPEIVNMAQNMMQNPQFQQMYKFITRFSSVAENLQAGGGLNLAGMMENLQSTFGDLQNDPNFQNNLRNQFRRDPGAEQ